MNRWRGWDQRARNFLRRMLPVPDSSTTQPILAQTERRHAQSLKRADDLVGVVLDDYRRQDSRLRGPR